MRINTILLFLLVISLLAACKKKDDDHDTQKESSKTFVTPLRPDNSYREDVFGSTYYRNKIAISGNRKDTSGALVDCFFIVVDNKGAVLLDKSFPDLINASAPTILGDQGYAMAGFGNSGKDELILMKPDGSVTSRIFLIDEAVVKMNVPGPVRNEAIRQIIYSRQGELIVIGYLQGNIDDGAFIARLDLQGHIRSATFYAGFIFNGLAQLSNDSIVVLSTFSRQPEANIMLADTSLAFPATYPKTKRGELFSRPDVPGFYAGFDEIDKCNNTGQVQYSFMPDPADKNFRILSLANDGGLVIIKQTPTDNDAHLMKFKPENGTVDWSSVNEVSPVGNVIFMHQLPDNYYLGISYKKGTGVTHQLCVFRMKDRGVF